MSEHQGWLDQPYHGTPVPPPEGKQGRVFIQWKGTDVCFDFTCPDCGAAGHFDGYFAYTIRCGNCERLYEMPALLYPRRVEKIADQGVEVRVETFPESST